MQRPCAPSTTARARRSPRGREGRSGNGWRRLRRSAGCVEDRVETLARTLTLEVGKPIRQSRNEISGLLSRIDFFLAETQRALREQSVLVDKAGGMEERIGHEPLGVIANISAWNYPYFVGGNVFVPALAAGNAVLYKPSEFATLTGQHIADLLHEAGVPEDVFVLGRRRRQDRHRAVAPARRWGVLHGLVRHRRQDRGQHRSPDDQDAARARRQGSDLRRGRRRRAKPPPRRSPTVRSTTPGSRAARSSGSTCTNGSTMHS